MNKCLVTKLKGTVNDISLLRLGEMRISVSGNTNGKTASGLYFITNNPVKLEIIGNGYFTDINNSNNLGKSMTINSNTESTVYLSNGTYDVAILDKYSLLSFSDVSGKYLSFNLEDFKWSKKMKSIAVFQSDLIGDIANLGELELLESIIFYCKNIFGDVSSFKNMFNLNKVILHNSNITGDLASLPAKTRYFSSYMNTGTFTWGTRSPDSNIIALSIQTVLANVDKMLIDQAKCKAAFKTNDESDFKLISVIGTRTSASDAAVETLQGKGYTVSITPA